MRILITNIKLSGRSGTEVLTADLARGLVAAGHEVAIYTRSLGPLARELKREGIVVSDRIADLAQFRPEIIHAHHSTVYAIAQSAFIATPSIWFCHDAFAWHDRPPLCSRIAVYVAHSIVTYNRLVYDGGIDAARVRIINNSSSPVTKPASPIPERIGKVLLVVKYDGAFVETVRRSCDSLGLDLDVVGPGVGRETAQIGRLLAGADLICASGKTAMDALVANRPVVCIDERGLAGLVTTDVFDVWQQRNFGGSILRADYSSSDLSMEIALYDPRRFEDMLDAKASRLDFKRYLDEVMSLHEAVLRSHEARDDVSLGAALEAMMIEESRLFGTGQRLAHQAQVEKQGLVKNLENERLRHFRFSDSNAMTFGEGEAGRAALDESWITSDPHVVWNSDADARISIPADTGILQASLIKIEGFFHSLAPDDRTRHRTVEIIVGGQLAHAETFACSADTKGDYHYFYWNLSFYQLDDCGETLEMQFRFSPFTQSHHGGKAFSLYKIWAIYDLQSH